MHMENANTKRTKKNPIGVTTIYDNIYYALHAMAENPGIPKTKYGITDNRKVHNIIIKNAFVKETTDKQLLKNCSNYKRLSSKYYIISQKGHDYMKNYEGSKELFNLE